MKLWLFILFLTIPFFLSSQELEISLFHSLQYEVRQTENQYLSDPLVHIDSDSLDFNEIFPVDFDGTNIWYRFQSYESWKLTLVNSSQGFEKYLERIEELSGCKLNLSIQLSSSIWYEMVRDDEFWQAFILSIEDFLLSSPLENLELLFPKDLSVDDIFWRNMEELTQKLAFYNQKLFIGIFDIPYEGLRDGFNYNLHSYNYSGKHSPLEKLEEQLFIYKYNDLDFSSLAIVIPLFGRIYNPSHLDYWFGKLSYKDIIEVYQPSTELNEIGGYFYNGINLLEEKILLAKEYQLRSIILDGISQDGPGIYNLTRTAENLIP
jgi:hypothetical protein